MAPKAAAIAMYNARRWHASGGGHIPGGLTLVLTWLMAGRGINQLLVKPLELHNSLAPFSKAAK